MTTWRTDMGNILSIVGPNRGFDVAVIGGSGKRWRETDCTINESGQICSYDRDWGFEPIEFDYKNGDFRRVTHWALIELPPIEE